MLQELGFGAHWWYPMYESSVCLVICSHSHSMGCLDVVRGTRRSVEFASMDSRRESISVFVRKYHVEPCSYLK
jgi:hypothetical protein